ncbi:serine-threonine/tyrosine-protein kinase catalytic domain-containing protein [Tanacetum coccineum]
MVAVKRLNEQFGQGLKEFLTEIQLLSGQRHPNLISLVGYCDEGREKTIVYEYAERGSLDQYIRRRGKSTSTTLTWLQRLKICADAARGLDHLHRHQSHRCLHNDREQRPAMDVVTKALEGVLRFPGKDELGEGVGMIDAEEVKGSMNILKEFEDKY